MKRACSVLLLALAACGGSQARPANAPAAHGAAAKGGEAEAPIKDASADDVVDLAPRNVRLVLNLAPLRSHPVGKRIGPMLAAMPQWKETMRGIVDDPVQQIDWVYLSGPSLVNSSKDGILMHHALSEESIEKAIDEIHKRSASVGPFDTGVRGVKGTIGNIDLGPRVLVRAQSDLLAVVPPDDAKDVARKLARSRVLSPADAKEALRAVVRDPGSQLPMVPSEVREARLVVIPKDDGGVDATAEGTCDDAASAQAVADRISGLIDDYNGILARLMLHGLLDAIEVTHEGATVRVHLPANQEQLEAVMNILARMLGAELRAHPIPPPTG